MNTKVRSGRIVIPLLIGIAVGLAVAAAASYVHQSGRLTLVYHALGLHSWASNSDKTSETPAMPMGHAGHGGMSMPQGAGEPAKLPGYSVVTISPERQQRIGVRAGRVERDRLLMFIRAVGIIEPDQTRLKRVHPRISGWVTKVHVNFVGQDVKKGDPLLEIYSPDLLTTQQEYLIALESKETQGAGKSSGKLAELTLKKLRLFGVADEEIRELEKTKKPRETLILRAEIGGRVLDRAVLEGSYVEPKMELYQIADLSHLWLQAKVYEYELPHIELNQPVHIELLSQPGSEIKGKVAFVEPVVQEMTRAAKVRVDINNPKNQVKPGMYANLKIDHDMGEGLLVPEEALLRTGERTLAFRVLPEGRFEPIEVTAGARFGERVQVLAGLTEGDEIVTSAVFLIDAESRLKSAVGAMGGHQHGGAETPPPKPVAAHEHEGHGAPKAAPKNSHQHDAGAEHHHNH
jgi:Cu(I)/Ag(I) efflux system membrane fusion protein